MARLRYFTPQPEFDTSRQIQYSDVDEDGVPNWIEQQNGTDPFRADTDGDSVSDLNDAFPLDPTRSMAPSSNPSDTTPPVVTPKEPVSARLITP